jgi:hypothetical protein
VQAKFGQYLQDAKTPGREQIRSNEQVLSTPGLSVSCSYVFCSKLKVPISSHFIPTLLLSFFSSEQIDD